MKLHKDIHPYPSPSPRMPYQTYELCFTLWSPQNLHRGTVLSALQTMHVGLGYSQQDSHVFSNGTSAADQHLQGACVPMYQAPYHMLVVSHVLGSWPGQLMLRNVLFTRLFPFSLLDVPRYLPYSYKAHAHAFIDKQRCTCAMKYDMIQHNTAWYNTIQYNTNALYYNPIHYNTIAMQHNTIAIQYNSNTIQ